MRGTDCQKRRADAGARTKAQGGFGMIDCSVELAGPEPEDAADVPTTRETRVEYQRAVNQGNHATDVLTEIAQRKGAIREDARIIAGRLQGSPREINPFLAIRLPIVAPVIENQPKAAERGPAECGSVKRIAGDRLLHKPERLRDLV